MKKLIELKEFDVITKERSLSDSTSYIYLEKNTFELLENMILSINENNDGEVSDFFKVTNKKNVGKVITAKNYVGIIQLKDGTQIQILPKIFGRIVEDPKKIFLKMLKALRDFPSKSFNETSLKTDKLDIFEVFINLYIKEVQGLLKKGLKSDYYLVDNNLNVYKGKIMFNQQIKHNFIHKERFYMQYDEFGMNRAENRLIKSTLYKLLKESTSAQNVKELRKLLAHFETIDPSANYMKDFSLVKTDRNMKDYQVIMQWSKIFLQNESFTTFSGDSFGKALLFPMEKIFEAYVGQYLKKLLLPFDNWNVSLQDRRYYLFEKNFALRPDIVLRDTIKQRTIVIDTKWKVLMNSPRKNYGISQADMYQVYAYAKKYAANEICLMYPITDEFKFDDSIEFQSDDNIKVKVFFVDCYRIEQSLINFIEAYLK
ncbi:McrC family protein [Priestia aryabhattai]|uniref:McrC family protein n=1 Tax=Priestia aryabhattai TaxID=412384 RepID=UPI001ADC33A8|nr:McrC family protein [Priestia aryabhattai]QTL51422.1 McrC family protein [Priestia aryabhattai]